MAMLVCDTAWLMLENLMGLPEMETKYHLRDMYKRNLKGNLKLADLDERVFKAFCYYEKHRDLIDAGYVQG